ncbi:MAG TPA: tricarballylate utilization 4Fe-4S protein TcuB [Vicinamibacterales bacterium]|jgi:citrate/tricarballylate utilization protein
MSTSERLATIREGARVMQICNACRYCEGFCAVFPAIEKRLTFSEPDLNYLANLCHDCGECYYSCQYAPPHEFAVNLPQLLAQIRTETYAKHAWPRSLSGLFRRQRFTMLASALIIPLGFLVALLLSTDRAALFGPHADSEGSFYRIVPHDVMVSLFGAVSLFVVCALAVALIRFWRDLGESFADLCAAPTLRRAATDSLTLRYLEGGGDGCAYPAEIPSQARRWFHHLTFYGFGLCFLATSVAAFYHNVLGWSAPYPVVSLPVVLGCLGGAGLLIGPVGLLWLKAVRTSEPSNRSQTDLDVAFLVMLFLTSLTGFLLLALRESAAMGSLLAVHLGLVLGLFLTLPYGKFVHGLYRFCALARHALETKRTVIGTLILVVAMTGGARAQTDSLTIIAPAAPGGGWDHTARAMQQALQQGGLSRIVKVVNVPGAGGTVGLAQFINANKGKGDVVLVTGLIMVGAVLTNKSPVTLAHVTPIARLTGEYEVLVVPAASPYRTLAEFTKAWKANPGKLAIAGGSAGGTDHMLAGLLASASGIDVTRVNYVPHSGGGESIASIVGAQVSAGINGFEELVPFIKAGRVRALAISSDQRLAGVEIPTFVEQGVALSVANWRGVVAPPGIDAGQKAALTSLIDRMQRSTPWKQVLARNHWIDMFQSGPAFEGFLRQEHDRAAGVLKSIGLVK